MGIYKQLNQSIAKENPVVFSRVTQNTFAKIDLWLAKLPFYKLFFLLGLLCIIVGLINNLIPNLGLLAIIKFVFADALRILTSSAVTIVSITLVVTNLLFTHLKDERDSLEQLILAKVKIKYVTFVGFSIIICLLVLNFITESTSMMIKQNILLTIFYCFLYYLWQLVVMYNQIMNLIIKSSRNAILISEQKDELSSVIYQDLFQNKFNDIFDKLFTSNQFSNIIFNQEPSSTSLSVVNSNHKQPFLVDIDVTTFSKILKSTNHEIGFGLFKLNQVYDKQQPLLILPNDLLHNQLTKCFVFNKNPIKSLATNKQIILKYSDEMLEKAVIKKDTFLINDALEMFKLAINFYLENNSGNNSDLPNYMMQLLSNIEKSVLLSSKLESDQSFSILILFVRTQISWPSINKSIRIYKYALGLPSRIYSQLPNKFSVILVGIFGIRFSEDIRYSSYYQANSISYLKITYQSVLKLTFEILNRKDYENFELLFKEFHTFIISRTQEAEIESLGKKFYFVLYSWIVYLTSMNQIEIEKINIDRLESSFIGSDIMFAKEDFIELFFELIEEAGKGFWDIEHWDIVEYESGEAHFALMSRDWLQFGLSCFLLRKGLLDYGFEESKINLGKYNGYELEAIKSQLQIVENNYEKLSSLTELSLPIDASLFEVKKENILKYFERIKILKDLDYSAALHKVPLSEKIIAEFKKKVGIVFTSNQFIIDILEANNRVVIKPNITEKLGYGTYTTLERGKMLFVDGKLKQDAIGISDVGIIPAQGVHQDFFRKLTENIVTIDSSANDAKEKLKVKIELKANKNNLAIFVHPRLLKLILDYTEYDITAIPFAKGVLDNVPVFVSVHVPSFIYLVDLTTIDYTIFENNEWFNNRLLVQVEELSEEQLAIRMAEVKEVKGKYNYFPLTSDEKNVFERSSVNIKVIFKGEVEITNPQDNLRISII
jgi:hypothetical protein